MAENLKVKETGLKNLQSQVSYTLVTQVSHTRSLRGPWKNLEKLGEGGGRGRDALRHLGIIAW